MEFKNQEAIAVTGVNGFVGKHLVRELISQEYLVVGIGREAEADPAIADSLHDYQCADLSKEWPTTLPNLKAVIHLAGLAAVGPSFDHPQDYISINSAIVTHMMESYVNAVDKPRFVVVSSGAVYDPNQPMPEDEGGLVAFSSPYSVSKILVENQCQYYRGRGLSVIVARPFNHTGPGQLGGFLVPDLIDGLNNLTENEKLNVGNLATQRDYTDVRDIVKAYAMLATSKKLQHNTYNICSGSTTSGQAILDLLVEIMKIKKPEIVIDQTLLRPNDPPEIVGDSTRLKSDTGWTPTFSLRDTLSDMVAEKYGSSKS